MMEEHIWRDENRRWHLRLAKKIQNPIMGEAWEALLKCNFDDKRNQIFIGLVFEDVNNKLYSYIEKQSVRGRNVLPKDIYKAKITILKRLLQMFNISLRLPGYSQETIFNRVFAFPGDGIYPPYKNPNYIAPGKGK